MTSPAIKICQPLYIILHKLPTTLFIFSFRIKTAQRMSSARFYGIDYSTRKFCSKRIFSQFSPRYTVKSPGSMFQT